MLLRKPIVSDTVLYNYLQGEGNIIQFPGIVTSIERDESVNLTVFFDHRVQSNHLIGHPTSVPFSTTPKGHTWTWPANANANAELEMVSAPKEPTPVFSPARTAGKPSPMKGKKIVKKKRR